MTRSEWQTKSRGEDSKGTFLGILADWLTATFSHSCFRQSTFSHFLNIHKLPRNAVNRKHFILSKIQPTTSAFMLTGKRKPAATREEA